ncbi:MAG: 5-(carboxyamino)imidazole ribonucleotide mutase [Rhodospirillaceae bacterium]
MAKKAAPKASGAKAAPLVGIVMGSQSDWETMRHAADTLTKLGIGHDVAVHSAHRTPDRLAEWVRSLDSRGVKVFIAGAGMAAALPGVVAAMTARPVFGVPMETRMMGGLDSLLSMCQMPAGIPVGVLAVGRAGAVNAALLTAAVLAVADARIAKAVDRFRAAQTDAVPLKPA